MDEYKHKKGALKLKKVSDRKQKVTNRSSKPSKKTAEFELLEGRVVSNDTTVHGLETQFMEKINVGDTIGINHPTSMQFEYRLVVAILSQRTLNIDHPFSSDLFSTTNAYVRKDSQGLQALTEDKILELIQKRSSAQHKSVLQVREKTGMWTYKTRSEKLENEVTAEDLLDMRIRREGRDKYC